MRIKFIIIVALTVSLIGPAPFAFAYGGGNGGDGGAEERGSTRRDCETPPAGFKPTEVRGKSGGSDRQQISPQEDKRIVEELGRQLSPEERRILEEMKYFMVKATKAQQQNHTHAA